MYNDVRWMSGGVALPVSCSACACAARVSHAFRRPPDVIIRKSFIRPSTALFVLQVTIAVVKAWERGYN